MIEPADVAPVRRPWGIRDVLMALLAGVLASGFTHLATGEEATVAELFGIILPVQVAATIATIALLAPRREHWRTALRASVVPADGWGVLMGAGLQLVLSLAAYWVIVEMLDGSAPTQEVVDAAADAIGGPERALVFLGVVVLGPLSEEIVFRGVLIRALEHRGRWFAILGSALAFASLHLIDPNAIVAVPFLFVLGVVLGYQVLETGRLGRGIAIHAGFNLVTVVALFAA